MRHRLVVPALLALACVVLAGCAAGAGSSPSIVGAWGSTAEHQPNLVFGEDGSVAGSDGCNRIMTKYTLDGDTATLKSWLSTKMACLGVDTWLSGASTLTVEGDSLSVKDSAGKKIGTLTRAQPTPVSSR